MLNFDLGLARVRHSRDTFWFLTFDSGPFQSPNEYWVDIRPLMVLYKCGCIQANLGKSQRCEVAKNLHRRWEAGEPSSVYFDHFNYELKRELDA